MSICTARLHNTCNALMLWMFSKQIRLQASPKLFGVNSWIMQMIRQWIPASWSGDRKCTGPKGAVVNSANWQFMTSDRSQVLATSNFRDWYAVVGEIPWSSVPKTTMDCDSLLWLPHCALPLCSKLALTCNICHPSVNMHCNSFTNHFSDADRNRQIILPLCSQS